ncbi:hypothetical protein [Sphingobium algorifonticola]|nr:hypothetical protein [Sphingobium algorifonticola]
MSALSGRNAAPALRHRVSQSHVRAGVGLTLLSFTLAVQLIWVFAVG